MIPKIWREFPQRYNLLGSKCNKCGATYFPPRKICPKCKSMDISEYKLPESGEIISYTIIRSAPDGFTNYEPYAIGVIKLIDGTKILSQIVDTDFENIDIGKKVKLVFRRLMDGGETGVITYGYKAVVTE
jgi:uncharacterized OB-fold protein